jgi:hypothetical protein
MKISAILGTFLASIGVSGIILGLLGIIDFEHFSYGLSSGIRVLGSIAISGCLLSAVSYGWFEYFDNKD